MDDSICLGDCISCGAAVLYGDSVGVPPNLYHEDCYTPLPPVSREVTRLVRVHGFSHLLRLMATAKPTAKHAYFITFTTREGIDRRKWLSRIRFELKRKHIVDFEASIEHKDSNIHCHALIHSSKRVKAQMLETYTNEFGFVSIKKVSKDNGIFEYMSKENDVTNNVENLSID